MILLFADCDLAIGQKTDEGSPARLAGGRSGGGVGLHRFGQALQLAPLIGGELERFADECLGHGFSFGLDCGQDGAEGMGRGLAFLAFEGLAEIAPGFGGVLPVADLAGDDITEGLADGGGLVGVGGRRDLGSGFFFGGDVITKQRAGGVEEGGLVLFGGQFGNEAAEPAESGGGVIAKAAEGDHLAVSIQSGVGQYGGVADGELAGADELLDVDAKVEEFKAELNADGADAGVIGAIGDGPVEESHAGMVGAGFVDGVDIGAGDVFGKHDGGGLLVGHVLDDAWDFFPLEEGDGAEPALAGDDLEEAGVGEGADGDGLDEAVAADVVGKVVKGGGVEGGAVVVAGGDAGAVDHGDCGHCILLFGAISLAS